MNPPIETSTGTFNSQTFQSPGKETKLCIIIDSKTPIIMKVPMQPESLTLKQFKEIASLQHDRYKFYFKSHDSEFGVVKEEVVDDNSPLPVDGDRIVAWVISNNVNQANLFQPESPYCRLDDSIAITDTTNSAYATEFTPSIANLTPDQSNILRSHLPESCCLINVQLNLDNYNFLGLTLVGPCDETGSEPDRGIFVGKIGKNSAVEQDGRIQIGDKIVQINGIDLRDMKNDDAVATFKCCVEGRGAINLVLERILKLSSYNKGRFTFPREYANEISSTYHASPPKLPESRRIVEEELPIPVFDNSNHHHHHHPTLMPRRLDQRSINRGAYSLPRSITPRSLYATDSYENNFTANNGIRLKLDSRSVYEPSTPTQIRQLDLRALHCERDNIHSIYAALRNDADNLDIKDREWLKVIIKNAFLGSALVKWLSRNVYGFSHRREIKRYANQMLSLGLIRSPMAKSTFSEKCYYTFN